MDDIVTITAQGISDYYDEGGALWDNLTTNTMEDLTDFLDNPEYGTTFNFNPVTAADGSILGYDVVETIPDPITDLPVTDSNLNSATYGAGNTFSGNIPLNVDATDPTNVTTSAGATVQSTGNVLKCVADKVSLAVMGVNIGAKLGKSIDESLYQLNPEWWNDHLWSVNPETWSSLYGVNPVGDYFLRTLIGVNPDNSMTGYVDEDVLVQYYQILRDGGAWGIGDANIKPSQEQKTSTNLNDLTDIMIQDGVNYTVGDLVWHGPDDTEYTVTFTSGGEDARIIFLKSTFDGMYGGGTILQASRSPTTGTYSYQSPGGRKWTYNNDMSYTHADKAGNLYYIKQITAYKAPKEDINITYTDRQTYSGMSLGSGVIQDLLFILFNGSIEHASTGIEGVNNMPNTTQYPPTNITGNTHSDVKTQLMNEYPDLFTGAVTQNVPQPDGTVKTKTYVPIPWVTPTTDSPTATTTAGKTQTDTEIEPEIVPQIVTPSTPNTPTQPPETGTGESPTIVTPTGSASSLWSVYNPSQSELNDFGAWLWSSNFVDQLKKLFNDPMQAIIGVHKVFATPSTSGSENIKCGYIDSGVSASKVSSQYTTIDCGSASLREYFGNVFDYEPHTSVSIFLPFIGIVPLNVADVMRSTISVKYTVDVITGACIAEIKVKRDGNDAILYTYGGSAIVSYPISSGSYIGAVSSVITTMLGIGAGIASGGLGLAAGAAMAIHGINSTKTSVQHSGQFTGSTGAMGGKKPYLIVKRPQTRTPYAISDFEGIPSNTIKQLSNYTGFTRVKECHVEINRAYESELKEIETLLQNGVIL